MKRGVWTAVTVLGLLLLGAALGLVLFNIRTDNAAAQSRDEILQELADVVQEEPAVVPEEPAAEPEEPDVQPGGMATVSIEGYAYMGTLLFPALNLELPVMATYALPNLQISPAVYHGTPAGKDLVICAHNYYSHFGRLNQLNPGDEVLLKTVDGKVYRYKVSVTEILDPSAVADVTGGEWPLTLFTCTISGLTRVVVRCDLQ